VELIIPDLPAAGWPACGRQGEDYMSAVGEPTEVSRKGKASPGHTHEVWVGLEGASIPFPIEPDRVTAEAFERRNNGFH